MTKKPHRVVVLLGDGIGPEIMEATLLCLRATGLAFEFTTFEFGHASDGLVSDEVVNAILEAGVALKSPTDTPIGEGHRSLNVQLRERLVLHTNIRPIRTVPGVTTRYSDVKIGMTIYRENLGDLYVGVEYWRDGIIVAEAHFDPVKIRRFAEFAYAHAARNGLTRMTIAVKPNILKLSHGTFLRIAQEVGEQYPEISTDWLIADNAFGQIATRPERFDGLMAPNFLGDLYSDDAAPLVGGLGFAPGANMGDDAAVFEAVHGTAPDIAGKGIANPSSLMGSSILLLKHIGEAEAATRFQNAMDAVLTEGIYVTRDVRKDSPYGTMDYARAIADRLSA